MNDYAILASLVLALHLLFILWLIFGALFTRRRPILRWIHLVSLAWGIVFEIGPWSCPLTSLESWLRDRAGLGGYQGGFLLHYLDALVYPNISPTFLITAGVAVCLFNLAIYLCAIGTAQRTNFSVQSWTLRGHYAAENAGRVENQTSRLRLSVHLASGLPGSIRNRENRRDERERPESLEGQVFAPNLLKK
jgi:hypothetical protein